MCKCVHSFPFWPQGCLGIQGRNPNTVSVGTEPKHRIWRRARHRDTWPTRCLTSETHHIKWEVLPSQAPEALEPKLPQIRHVFMSYVCVSVTSCILWNVSYKTFHKTHIWPMTSVIGISKRVVYVTLRLCSILTLHGWRNINGGNYASHNSM